MATAQNTTQRVGVRTLPKPKSGTPAALKQATAELEASVAELLLSRSLLDLEEPLREARYMASIVNLLVHEHGTNLPPNGTFELSEDEMSRLLFLADKVEGMITKLDDAYHAAMRNMEVAQ